MAYNDRSRRGVGGWLAGLLLVFATYAAVVPAGRAVARLYSEPGAAAALGDRWIALQALEWCLAATVIVSWVYLAWRLYARRVWRSVQLAIAGLWLIAPVWRTLEMNGNNLLLDAPVDDRLIFDLIGHSIEPAIWAMILTAYLLRSRRVADAYGRRPGADELGAVFD